MFKRTLVIVLFLLMAITQATQACIHPGDITDPDSKPPINEPGINW